MLNALPKNMASVNSHGFSRERLAAMGIKPFGMSGRKQSVTTI